MNFGAEIWGNIEGTDIELIHTKVFRRVLGAKKSTNLTALYDELGRVLLIIDNNFFESMVNRIYPSELQLNKANVSDTEASFLDLHLSISDGFVKTKIYDKREDFDFDIVNFPF